MATAAIIAECPTTFSLQSQSSFGHCEECGRPVVYVAKRKSSHSCESATPPQQTASRRSSAVAGWLPAALVEFLFGDKASRALEHQKPRMVRSATLSLAIPRPRTFHQGTTTTADAASSSSSPDEFRGQDPNQSLPSVATHRQMRNSVA